ncbi:hypothetical protein Q5384_14320 [Enterobacter ludwigii]|uniref:tail fiber/spike domain-containing protein n=1 Tax=Enterobacter ludwigii TaxID=299767 RepID=UPI002B4C08B8|nr:hypothetical protein [Enterobacter ludwigii]WRM03008.1 hypothetical protein Q5384_14320 [Enterobacter ludwigii]
MATQPTNLPVPSESPRDLKFNAGKIDEFVTSLVNTYVDRFGNEHYTIEGLRWLAQQAIAQYGWILIDSFQDGADITLPNQALRDEDTGEYYRWDGALPKHVAAGSTPATAGGVGVGAWIGIGDASLRAMLATSSGAGMVGGIGADGNPTTVQNILDEHQGDIDGINSQITTTNGRVQYLYNDRNKVFSSSDVDKQYAAFCDSCIVLGKETFIHRCSTTHLDDGGGVSSLMILQKENGELVQKFIITPIAGYDFRDPSIMYDPVSRRIVVSVQAFNVSAGTYNGGSIYIFSTDLSLQSSSSVGATGYFQWGKVLRTPAGKMLVACYAVSGGGIRLYTSSGNFDTPTSFSLTATILNTDATVFTTEVSLFYWKEFLVAAARTQLVSDQSIQNLRYTYTRDLSGSSGWIAQSVLPAALWVAPRMVQMSDGALCITGGSIFSGFRGSVAATITYDLTTFSTTTTIFRVATGNGGYHGVMLTRQGLAIYSYIETVSLTKSDTFLSYMDETVVQMMARQPSAPLSFFSPNNVTYIGGQPFGTAATTGGGYVTIFLKNTINNCRGLVLNLGGTTGGSAQSVLLQNSDGTLFATMGGVNVSATGTYYASHAGINIPAGTYRITIAGAYVATGTRINTSIDTLPDNRVYGLVNVNGTAASAAQDVFVGFAV